jgi:hypothetical protein
MHPMRVVYICLAFGELPHLRPRRVVAGILHVDSELNHVDRSYFGSSRGPTFARGECLFRGPCQDARMISDNIFFISFFRIPMES